MFVHIGRSSGRESRPVDAGLEVRVRPQLHQSGDDEVATSTLVGRCALLRQRSSKQVTYSRISIRSAFVWHIC